MASINRLRYALRYVPISLILFYKFIFSPFFPMSCRFHPTCSSYAMEAFKRYGILKGVFLTITRLLKCHPFHPGGYDPVK